MLARARPSTRAERQLTHARIGSAAVEGEYELADVATDSRIGPGQTSRHAYVFETIVPPATAITVEMPSPIKNADPIRWSVPTTQFTLAE